MFRLLALAFLAPFPAFASGAAAGTQQLVNVHPPGQPSSGPGGSSYPFAYANRLETGQEPWSAIVFEPVPAPKESAPVVVFLHGWQSSVGANRLWLSHLTRRGNYVIFPRYEDPKNSNHPVDRSVHRENFSNAVRGIKVGLEVLKSRGAKIDLTRVAMTGQSYGAILGSALAAKARKLGLPEAKALFFPTPGNAQALDGILRPMAEYLSHIPKSTLALLVVCDHDDVVGEQPARDIYGMLSSIPAKQKNILLMQSDSHGTPALVADHSSPTSRQEADALDYLGYWKLFDALMDSAFSGKNSAMALGGGPEQLGIGAWSDGVPVKPLKVLK